MFFFFKGDVWGCLGDNSSKVFEFHRWTPLFFSFLFFIFIRYSLQYCGIVFLIFLPFHSQVVIEKYDCVICNQASPSNTDRPMCLVVLLQATSVLAHRRPHSALSLPLCDEERSNLNKIDSLVIISPFIHTNAAFLSYLFVRKWSLQSISSRFLFCLI